MDNELPITTPRLILRNFSTDDIPAIIRIVSHPKFSGYRQFRIGSIADDVAVFIESAIKRQEPDSETGQREIWRLAVCLNLDTVIGYCCLWEWSGRVEFSPELGYFLDPEYQGHGYITEAAKALVEFFQKQNPGKPIFSMAHPENVPSQNVLIRLGFKETGETVISSHGIDEPRITYCLYP